MKPAGWVIRNPPGADRLWCYSAGQDSGELVAGREEMEVQAESKLLTISAVLMLWTNVSWFPSTVWMCTDPWQTCSQNKVKRQEKMKDQKLEKTRFKISNFLTFDLEKQGSKVKKNRGKRYNKDDGNKGS